MSLGDEWDGLDEWDLYLDDLEYESRFDDDADPEVCGCAAARTPARIQVGEERAPCPLCGIESVGQHYCRVLGGYGW